MKLTSHATILDFEPYRLRTETTPTHNLGEFVNMADGRRFRYGKVGAVAVTKGKLQTAPAAKANHHNLVVLTAAATGSLIVTVTLGATAAVANEYAEGYLVINDNAGEGQVYQISSHPAAASSATLALTLFDPIQVALTGTSDGTLVPNNYSGFIEGTSATIKPAGVPLLDLGIGNFGWVQTGGIAGVLAGGTIGVGGWCVADGSVAGAVALASATIATTVVQNRVGYAVVAGVSTEYRPVFLTID